MGNKLPKESIADNVQRLCDAEGVSNVTAGEVTGVGIGFGGWPSAGQVYDVEAAAGVVTTRDASNTSNKPPIVVVAAGGGGVVDVVIILLRVL